MADRHLVLVCSDAVCEGDAGHHTPPVLQTRAAGTTGPLQLDTHDDVNSFLLFHEEVDPHGGFEQHVSLPEFDVSGQGLSFGRLEPSESSNIDHGLANGLAFGIRSLMLALMYLVVYGMTFEVR